MARYYGVSPSLRVKRPVAFRAIRQLWFLYRWRVRCLVRAFRPDFCWIDGQQNALLTVKCGWPTALEVHTPDDLPRSSAELLARLPAYRGTVYITRAVAEACRGTLMPEAHPFIVVPDGAAPAIEATVWPRPPGFRLHLGYVGSLTQGKGLELVAQIAPALTDVAFHIVGGSAEEVAQWRERLPGPNVTFYGYRPHGEIAGFLRSIDGGLVPNQPVVVTRGWRDIGRYTSPLKMFEYMAYGKAVLASDLPVLREVLREDFALLLPHDDPAAWIEAIRAATPESLSVLGARGGEEISSRYTWRHRAQSILGAFAPRPGGARAGQGFRARGWRKGKRRKGEREA